jgi:hypothetical protein
MQSPAHNVLLDEGPMLEWHGSIVEELGAVQTWHRVGFARHEVVNEWRRRTAR